MQLASASTRAVTLPPAQRSVPVASVPANLTSMTSAAVQTPVAVTAMAQAQPRNACRRADIRHASARRLGNGATAPPGIDRERRRYWESVIAKHGQGSGPA